MALMACDVGRGDAVFLPSFTFTATAEAPAILGATPIFVDVLPDTFDLDPLSFERAVAEVDEDAEVLHERQLALAARALLAVLDQELLEQRFVGLVSGSVGVREIVRNRVQVELLSFHARCSGV